MNSEAAAYFPDALPNAPESDLPASDSTRPICESSPHLLSSIGSSSQQSDEELLRQVVKGSRDALSILFQRHARRVFHVAQRILRDKPEAEDLLQELFLFLFQKARVFDPERGSAASWIIQMTYQRAIDRRRYLGSRHHYNTQELKDEHLVGNRRQLSVDELAGKALLSRVRKELSKEQWQTMELHFFEGYSFHEIAEKTGQSFGNVRNHYYRGMQRLRTNVFPEKHA